MAKAKLMDQARDELFSHINRCGVLEASREDQAEWMEETIQYLAERFPDLGELEIGQLREIGIRFCQPAIPHGLKRAEAEDTEQVEADANAI